MVNWFPPDRCFSRRRPHSAIIPCDSPAISCTHRHPMFCSQPQICRSRNDITRRRVAGGAFITGLMSCLHGALICQPMERAGPVEGSAHRGQPAMRGRHAALNTGQSSLKCHFCPICSSVWKRANHRARRHHGGGNGFHPSPSAGR